MANLNSQKLKTINAFEVRDPNRSLWRNVLIVALEDALGRSWRNKMYGHPKDRNFVRSARDYFLYPNSDFKTVCELAGFDHLYVRMKARKYFSQRRKYEKNMSKV